MFYPCPSVCPSVCPSPLKSLYNQLLQKFLSNQSETLNTCCRYIEDVHLPLLKKPETFFDKITAFSNLENRQVMANSGYQE